MLAFRFWLISAIILFAERYHLQMSRSDGEIAVLIDGAQQGNAECFDGLIDAYADRMYGYFYRATGSRTAAEDLLQELFLRLIQAVKRYDHREQFDAYLFRIAANLKRDLFRKDRRSRLTRSSTGLDEPRPETCLGVGGLDDRAGGPAQTMEQAEQIDEMQEAMTRLPAAEREVIVLRHFSELSFKEIASIMQTPVGTALARAHRGLNRLRQLLGATTHE